VGIALVVADHHAEHLAMRDRVGMVDLLGVRDLRRARAGAAPISSAVVNKVDVAPGADGLHADGSTAGGILADLTIMRLPTTHSGS
jgi:glycine cleavage system aminomethyltransferase T